MPWECKSSEAKQYTVAVLDVRSAPSYTTRYREGCATSKSIVTYEVPTRDPDLDATFRGVSAATWTTWLGRDM